MPGQKHDLLWSFSQFLPQRAMRCTNEETIWPNLSSRREHDNFTLCIHENFLRACRWNSVSEGRRGFSPTPPSGGSAPYTPSVGTVLRLPTSPPSLPQNPGSTSANVLHFAQLHAGPFLPYANYAATEGRQI